MTQELETFNGESFSNLFEQSYAGNLKFTDQVLKGRVVGFDGEMVIVDVGLKSEGRVPKREFGNVTDLNIGDEVDVYIDRFEGKDGSACLSREKARREEAWIELEKLFKDGVRVNGTIVRRVKGGFTVDLSGSVAFLPGSQVDIRPIRDINSLMGVEQPFAILKMERNRNNIVVSRRAILEENKSEAQSAITSNLEEGQILEGVVKNITDYGAFIDLGGIDGLLHVTDISWSRINHPSQALSVGQSVKVQVIRYNKETNRISLGMKQLEQDPWTVAASKYQLGQKYKGRITNITDYGAFVELESGIEGLVHVSEMSWTRKNIHPGKLVSTSQEVEVVVLDSDVEKRRISLGIKQLSENPWIVFANRTPVGTEIEGAIRNITEFGLFIALDNEIDGMAHLNDLSWTESGDIAISRYKKGDIVKAKVLDIDFDKERVSLGMKQLSEDPFTKSTSSLRRGDIVTTEVTGIDPEGISVKIGDITAYIKKFDLGKNRDEQKVERFSIGQEIQAKIVSLDNNSRSLTLSIKALEIDEEKQAIAEFSSEEVSNSLGDAFSEALAKKES